MTIVYRGPSGWYSPGPWRAFDNRVVDRYGRQVCYVHPNGPPSTARSKKITANLKLIAAAIDLHRIAEAFITNGEPTQATQAFKRVLREIENGEAQPTETNVRWCPSCEQEKPHAEFIPRYSKCRSCRNLERAQRQERSRQLQKSRVICKVDDPYDRRCMACIRAGQCLGSWQEGELQCG